jgi:large subunit ribosomal protein L32
MKAETPAVQACPKCGDPKMPHRVCPTCGTYKGEQVFEVEEI